jgi:hypothetical protein
MQDYRAYFLGLDGHVMDRVDLWCPDDEAAKEPAKQLADGNEVELWHRARKIAEFTAASGPSDPPGDVATESALTVDQLKEEIAKQIDLMATLICEARNVDEAVEANAKLEALTRELIRQENLQAKK